MSITESHFSGMRMHWMQHRIALLCRQMTSQADLHICLKYKSCYHFFLIVIRMRFQVWNLNSQRCRISDLNFQDFPLLGFFKRLHWKKKHPKLGNYLYLIWYETSEQTNYGRRSNVSVAICLICFPFLSVYCQVLESYIQQFIKWQWKTENIPCRYSCICNLLICFALWRPGLWNIFIEHN